ncbi:enoyl-CoA hydratase/isomerase family protein [Peribacillus butanolivorans]|uniref:enoyl-CoA hydratase/isomerase family protein n=1 Tax=Peribacillus butanolivorans TaxID=421767 RepID=UPI00399CFD26
MGRMPLVQEPLHSHLACQILVYMDGIVMGGGVGLSFGASERIITPDFSDTGKISLIINLISLQSACPRKNQIL